ncbi:RNA helicase [Coprinopsis marcescibilis]|uniref:RNA helicase n=1 Tax=Coprinopsis marcescibilis TaxID=230819 RepID=A0A5C3L666_COPMA|nr:RNA helicase [Coprinopsis marcescibilis]
MNAPSWDSHVNGQKHRRVAFLKGVSPFQVEPQEASSVGRFTFCNVCKMQIRTVNWGNHITKSQKHLGREAFLSYRSALDEAENDKNGLTVEGGGDLGYLDPSNLSATSFIVNIKSTLPFGKSVLLSANLASKQGAREVVSGFSVISASHDLCITSNRPVQVKLSFRQRFIGRYEDRLELVFVDTQLRKKFVISRPLNVIVGSKSEHEALKPALPYTPRPRTTREPEKNVVEGVPPPSSSSIPYVVSLPRAPIPNHLLVVLNGTESVAKQVEHIKRVHLPSKVSGLTYARHFKNLLWIEEHKTEADLGRYDMTQVTLQRHERYYYLEIPGLAEKRPSVLVGDRIHVQKINAPTGHWFEGHVHFVRQREVGLCFHRSFVGWTPSQGYNIRFKLNRIVVRRQHQALDSAFEEDRALFPLRSHIKPATRWSLAFCNPLISKNQPQVQAVTSIAYLPDGSPPFVVFGPPGTGKTITIVEAIRQVLKANPRAKVLACAPSNSAADIIAERLCSRIGTTPGLGPDTLFRMYAPSRHKDQVPDKLRDHVHTTLNGHFTIPTMARMKSFRVVVATCVAASMASGVGMPRGHFTHIFIDEAGQATEPEAFISIKTMADSGTNIILSGDPKQLGPIIRSPIARILGLETSYLERLMSYDMYDVGLGSSGTVVKLTKNFRSHEAILKFPNERFYSGDLEPCANRLLINSYLNSPFLPENPRFPVVFHAVSGKDDREASSPSFFNIEEALQVKSYIQRLKDSRQFRASDNEIGVIAPYHAQCLKIRNVLRNVADGVKVGSVEEFQGQERKVIIISTVRSSKDFVEYDLRHTLGFVASPRRFNVAVTRAQALLIVVGNPQVLGLDPLWRAFLNYIYDNDGWTGSMDIPWDPEEELEEGTQYDARARRQAELDMNEFTRRMESLTLGNAEEVDAALEEDANVDRPWRDAE